jgi:hypothetical protein
MQDIQNAAATCNVVKPCIHEHHGSVLIRVCDIGNLLPSESQLHKL